MLLFSQNEVNPLFWEKMGFHYNNNNNNDDDELHQGHEESKKKAIKTNKSKSPGKK